YEIERKEVQRVRLPTFCRLVNSRSVLQKLEAGNTVLVERYHFPIEHGRFGANGFAQGFCDFRKLFVHHVTAARDHAHLAVLDEADGAITVPLHLIEPIATLWNASGG